MMSTHNKQQGVILITVLWVVMVLSLIAVGLSRRSSLGISFLDTCRGKVRAQAAAQGALNKILDDLIRNPTTKDVLNQIGIKLPDGLSAQDVWENIKISEDTHASVKCVKKNKDLTFWGLCDEGSKMDLNSLPLNQGSYKVLQGLLDVNGVPTPDAQSIAAATVDFVDDDSTPLEDSTGNALGYEMAAAGEIKPKNNKFEHIEEILNVRGMTQEIFDKIKYDITVYNDSSWINTYAASDEMIMASALGEQQDSASVLNKARPLRDGEDGIGQTGDDGNLDITSVSSMPPWPTLLKGSNENGSNQKCYSARITGFDDATSAQSRLDVILCKDANNPKAMIIQRLQKD